MLIRATNYYNNRVHRHTRTHTQWSKGNNEVVVIKEYAASRLKSFIFFYVIGINVYAVFQASPWCISMSPPFLLIRSNLKRYLGNPSSVQFNTDTLPRSRGHTWGKGTSMCTAANLYQQLDCEASVVALKCLRTCTRACAHTHTHIGDEDLQTEKRAKSCFPLGTHPSQEGPLGPVGVIPDYVCDQGCNVHQLTPPPHPPPHPQSLSRLL